jgi:hypothetical protein
MVTCIKSEKRSNTIYFLQTRTTSIDSFRMIDLYFQVFCEFQWKIIYLHGASKGLLCDKGLVVVICIFIQCGLRLLV